MDPDDLASDCLSNNYKRTEIGLTDMDDLISNSWGVATKQYVDAGSNDIEANTVKIDGKLTLNGTDVGETLKTLQERFLILEADFEKHKQYPALKDAYEQYKLIEALMMESK